MGYMKCNITSTHHNGNDPSSAQVLSYALEVDNSSFDPDSSRSARFCRRYSSSFGILTRLRRQYEVEMVATETKKTMLGYMATVFT